MDRCNWNSSCVSLKQFFIDDIQILLYEPKEKKQNVNF